MHFYMTIINLVVHFISSVLNDIHGTKQTKAPYEALLKIT